MRYKRILIKISGESLSGENKNGFNAETTKAFMSQIVELKKLGVEICIVIGGGNIVRGVELEPQGVARVTADHMGMLGTIINAIFLQNFFEKEFNVQCRVMSAIPVADICEGYITRRALRHLEKGRIVIFAAGTGNPFFSTDTSSVLRAVETNCDVIFKGTKTDGVYSSDPKIDKNAQHYKKISYDEILEKNLQIMDGAAVALARDSKIPIVVFSIFKKGNMMAVLQNNCEDCTIIN